MSDVVTRRSRRIQAAIDSGAALVLAMLAWPFPLARAMLPLPVNIISVLVFWQVVQVAYCALAAGAWGSTAGTRLQGIVLVDADGGEPTRLRRAQWGALVGAAALVHIAVPPLDSARTLAERASGIRLHQQ
jgi:hypothetical protein